MTLHDKGLFHPLEISICGYSGSGKTTLVQKLIEKFSARLDVGYIKHDAHRFEMDREGKDTYKAVQAGARQVAISSPEKIAILTDNYDDRLLFNQSYLDNDVVFIEGYKESLGNKIMMWSGSEKDHELLEKYTSNPESNLLAIAGHSEIAPTTKVPYFHRDDIDGLYSFLDLFWKERFSSRPLYGLILSGGRSTRMGRDKGAMQYHGESQVSYLYGLLYGITQRTFVSCRSDQVQEKHIQDYESIEDRYIGFGPTGGILSAFHKYPQAAWLVLACDMPFINRESIQQLLEKRNPYKMATCFYNGEKRWPEPLCTIYEPKAAMKLGYYLAMGKSCPRKVLMNSKIECLDPENSSALKNANTPDDYDQALESLGGSK